jgi:hypothetical protein
MKKLALLAALGLILAAGAAVTVLTVTPQSAVASCTNQGC